MRARRGRVVGMSTKCSGRHKGTRRPPWAGRGWRAHAYNHNHFVCAMYICLCFEASGQFVSVHATVLLTQVVACYNYFD